MIKGFFRPVAVLMLSACISAPSQQRGGTGYDFGIPDRILVIPDTLREISGLTLLDDRTFACIQDENGILFIYDLVDNEIRKQTPFHLDGDYEGITRAGNTMYVLRSDGTLFEIADFRNPESDVSGYPTGIPASNNEGLCHDSANNRLLIACKGKIGKGPTMKDKRVIYGFDLGTKSLTPEPVFDFDIRQVTDFAHRHHLNLPEKTRKKKGETATEPFIKFRTSAIGIHPLTGKLFLLSAADHMLFVFDMSGTLLHLEQLNPKLFNKAEGISFFPNGDVLITNEGQNRRPTVLRFNYQLREE